MTFLHLSSHRPASRVSLPALSLRPDLAPLAALIPMLFLGTVAGTTVLPLTAWAQDAATALPAGDAVKTFNVPAGPLDAALDRLARTAGVNLAYDAAQIAGLTTQGIHGEHTVASAISIVLSGTGFEATPQPGGGYSLRRVAGAASVGAAGGSAQATMPAVRVSAQTVRDGTTEGSASFTPATTSSATHLPLSLRDTPQSVTVLTNARIQADSLVDLLDVAKVTPGLSLSSSDARPFLSSRGYAVESITQDGIKSEYFPDEDTLGNLAMQDRVEVVRGATGLVQGGGNPSATINLVRKRPTDVWQYKGSISAGSWDNYRLMADVGGPLTSDGRIRGRVVGYFQNAGDYYDLAFNDKRLGYATVDVDLTPRTTLNIGYSHLTSRKNRSWGGLPTSYAGAHLNLPRSTFGGANWEYDKNDADSLYVNLKHDFGEAWNLLFNGVHVIRHYDMLATWLVPTPEVGGYGHVWYAAQTPRKQTALDLKVSGPVTWFGRRHELLFGATVNRQTRQTDEWFPGWNTTLTSGVNPATWNHVAPRPDTSRSSPWFTSYPSALDKQYAVYLTGRFNVVDPINLLLGARLDWFNKEDPSGGERFSLNAHLTKYAGLTWNFSAQHSAYVSYSDIFQPQNLRGLNGRLLPPRSGRNYEIGVKGEYLAGALNASLALFRTDESNRAAYLSDQTGCSVVPQPCYAAAGLVRTEGVDVELQGALATGWQIGTGMTWSTTRYRKDADPDNVGKRLDTTAPTTVFKLSTQYNLPGKLNQLTLGGRVNWQSKMFRMEENVYGETVRIEQGARAIVDLTAMYRLSKNLNLKLDVNNLFDKVYYASIGYGGAWGSTETYGRPRSLLLTLSAAM